MGVIDEIRKDLEKKLFERIEQLYELRNQLQLLENMERELQELQKLQRPELARPKLAKPELIRPEPAKPEPAKPEEPAEPEPRKNVYNKVQWTRTTPSGKKIKVMKWSAEEEKELLKFVSKYHSSSTTLQEVVQKAMPVFNRSFGSIYAKVQELFRISS